MFNILKQAAALAPVVEAPKRNLFQKLVGAYKYWKGKRAFKALALTKREEKAAQHKSNSESAEEMEARSEILITESVLCKDPVEANRLFEEAVELATKASSLRFN